jgi:transposase
MAMGESNRERQSELWIAGTALPRTPGHPFYEKLNGVLAEHGFDAFAQEACAPYYAEKLGRPSLAPAVYFKMLFIGFFEGIDSERGIAWRVADSMALRDFLGYALTEGTPDHSTLSRTRRLLSLETHHAVFTWVLGVLTDAQLLRGDTLGIDATTLEANAALRSIVRRDTGETYQEFLTRLAQASGIETPTREDLAKIDKNRPGKGSNKDWRNPHDPDARITKMKDGRTHLAHKSEHAVDLETGAIVAVTLQGADQGDTTTIHETLDQTKDNICDVAQDRRRRNTIKPLREIVADKGYHSNDTLRTLHEGHGLTTCISEPDRGRRKWKDKPAEKKAVYKNRQRIKSEKGIAHRKRRGEIVERSFAHCYDTGAMRRTHLKHHDNILKRLLIHVGAFNLSLLFRKINGAGTPRMLWDAPRSRSGTLRVTLRHTLRALISAIQPHEPTSIAPVPHRLKSITNRVRPYLWLTPTGYGAFTTGC